MASKRLEDMEIPELLDYLRGVPQPPGGDTTHRVSTVVQVRLAEKQDTSARALVEATKGLGNATKRLVCATWGLVGATLVLVLAEVVLRLVNRP